MSPRVDGGVEHYNPLFVLVLPKERRARHPYQLWIMVALVAMPASQLILGIPPNTSTRTIPDSQAIIVNVLCLVAGFSGLYAAYVPERVVHWFRLEFDATWTRLIVEAASHGLLAFIWATYVAIIMAAYPIWTRDGYLQGGVTLGGGLAFFLGCAAVHRFVQITLTIIPLMGTDKPTAIVGEQRISDQDISQAADG